MKFCDHSNIMHRDVHLYNYGNSEVINIIYLSFCLEVIVVQSTSAIFNVASEYFHNHKFVCNSDIITSIIQKHKG